MKITHKVINGDSRQMSELKEKSVHLIITSPPLSVVLKTGMAEVDSESEFRYKEKFNKYIAS